MTLEERPKMLDLSDSHTHLEDYGPQLPEVVQRARDVGVRRIITAGSSLESSKAAVRIAEEYPDIYAGVGIHPHAAHLNVTEETFDELRSLAKSSEKGSHDLRAGPGLFQEQGAQGGAAGRLPPAPPHGPGTLVCLSCSTAGRPTGTACAF